MQETINPDGSDQRSEPTRTALLVDPYERRVRLVTINGYESIRALFPKKASLEANTLCRAEGEAFIYWQSWVHCEEFMSAPAWRTSLSTSFAPGMAMHGLTLIDAYDMSTGKNVDCPLSLPQFEETIDWEDFENRREFMRPNKEWADKGGYEWAIGDGEGNIHASGSTWEEAGR